MDKNFTLIDVQLYLQEISRYGKPLAGRAGRQHGPSQSTLRNLLSYSGALNVLKTESAGTIFQLMN
jgi:hypothetical protein